MKTNRNANRKLLVVIGAWFAAALLGGVAGIFDRPGQPPVGVGLFLVVPIAGFIAAYRLSGPIRRALERIPLWLLTIAHTWRFVGLGFVLAAVAGSLPKQFGYPEGFGDIIAAAAAIPLAVLLARRPHVPRLRSYYLAWNVFGLIDLVSAVTLGILYSPSSFGLLREAVSTQPLTQFPVNLIPTFFVPLFILIHLLGIRRSVELPPRTRFEAGGRTAHASALASILLMMAGCATASGGEYTTRWARPTEIGSVTLPDGSRLRTVTMGSGPPLVLLHTIRTQLDYFEAVIRPLAARYRVYAIDLPGHGQSSIQRTEYTEPMMRAAVAQLITKLDLHEVTLVGESIGGVLALTVAAERPDRISRVVSINPYDYGRKFGGGIRNGSASGTIGAFHAFGGVETKGLLTHVLRSGFHDPAKLSNDFAAEVYRTGLRKDYRRMEYSVFDNWQSWVQAKALYPMVVAPTTLVYSQDDWSRPGDRSQTQQLIAGVRVITVEQAGHFLSLERPDAVVSAVLE